MATGFTSPADDASDRLVDNDVLKVVRRNIGVDWKELGRELQIPEPQLDGIYQQFHAQGLVEMACKMLQVWTQTASTKASISFLAAQLEEIGRKDLSDMILKMPPESSHGNRYPNQLQELSEAEWLKRLRNKLRDKYKAYVMKGLPWMGNIRISLADYYVDLSVEADDSNKSSLKMFPRQRCGRSYTTLRCLRCHVRTIHERDYVCTTCGQRCTTSISLRRHERNHEVKCPYCVRRFRDDESTVRHCANEHTVMPTSPVFHLDESAYNNYCARYTYMKLAPTTDVHQYLHELGDHLTELLQSVLKKLTHVKYWSCISLTLEKFNIDGAKIGMPIYLCSSTQSLFWAGDIANTIDIAFDKILHQLERFHKLGSGWVVVQIDKFDVHVGRFKYYFWEKHAKCTETG